MANERIKERVKRGGHFIPRDVVARRFYKGIKNLFNLYRPLVDSWMLFDNAEFTPRVIAKEETGNLDVRDEKLFQKIQKMGTRND